MSSDLLGEIEREAVRANADLPTLLRKCVALGGMSGSIALREWATRELRGYGEGDTLPLYRTVLAIVALDGTTMTHRVTGQQISAASLPDVARDLIEEAVPLYGPIAELTDAIKDARDRGESHINFGIPAGTALTALTNHRLRTMGVPHQTIGRLYWKTGVTSLVEVVDTVQTCLVQLAAELRAGVGRGQTVPDKVLADRAANIVIYGARSLVQVAHAAADAGGTAEASAVPERESKARTIMYWGAGGATVAGAEQYQLDVYGEVTDGNRSNDVSVLPKDVVILGAGFSHALYEPFPLTDELGELVRSRLLVEDRAKMPPGEFEDGRFEEWLSYLSERQPHLDPEGVAEAALLAMRVTRVICEILSELQTEALSTEPDGWFYEFLSVLHVLRAQVITLNYDNFVESGVHTLGLQIPNWVGAITVGEDDILAGLPPIADFPGWNFQSSDQATDDGFPIRIAERRSNTFKLWKLHGSLSWYWLPDGGGNSTLQRWRLPGEFGNLWDPVEEHRHQELPSHEVFIVPPAALKGQRLREPVARELWHRAAQALRSAERLVLVGYSVPQADHSVMGMLSEGLRGRTVRVEVVNPCPDKVVGRLVRLGVPADAITSITGKDCIARWSAAEVKRLARQAVDALKNDTGLTGEILMFSDGPRMDRFNRLDPPTDASSPLILHVVPDGQGCAKPVMYSDLRDAFGSATECVIETDGRTLPVIDHWVRLGSSGMPTTQLHLVTTR